MEWRGRKFGTIVWWFHLEGPFLSRLLLQEGEVMGPGWPDVGYGSKQLAQPKQGSVMTPAEHVSAARSRKMRGGQSWLYYTASHLRLHKTLTGELTGPRNDVRSRTTHSTPEAMHSQERKRRKREKWEETSKTRVRRAQTLGSVCSLWWTCFSGQQKISWHLARRGTLFSLIPQIGWNLAVT